MEEQIGALLQSAPDIVERILRNLSARDIQRLAVVCRFWRKYAAIVLKERCRIVTMTVVEQNQPKTGKSIIDNPETKQFLRDLDMECGLVIFFQENFRYYPCDPCAGSCEALRSCLPPSFTAIGATVKWGIIGTSADGSCHDQRSPPVHCLSAFLLPKLPREGTHVTHFSLSGAHVSRLVEQCECFDHKLSLADFADWPEDKVAKCIIIVAADYQWLLNEDGANDCLPFDSGLINAIHTAFDGKVALAGGITDEVFGRTKLRFRREPACVGLIFGGENVRAASMVIRPEVKAKEDVEKRLTELKAMIDGWGECKQKIAFVFTSDKRSSMFNFDGGETGIFRQLMPDIPLNGMFSDMGQFGWDYPPPAAVQPANGAQHYEQAITFAVIGFV